MIKMDPVARKIQYDSELSNIEEENKNKDPQWYSFSPFIIFSTILRDFIWIIWVFY